MSPWTRGLGLAAYAFGRLGRPGAFGAAALVAAWLLHTFGVGLLERDTAKWQRQAARQVAEARAAELPDADRPERVRAHSVPRSFDRLFEAAEETGLVIARGEYQVSREADASFNRYRIHLPVRGSYPALRAFIAQALNDNPALALDGLSLRRERIETEELEASLRFSLYVEVLQ